MLCFKRPEICDIPPRERSFLSSPVVTQCHHLSPGRITWFCSDTRKKKHCIHSVAERGWVLQCHKNLTPQDYNPLRSCQEPRVFSAFSSNLLLCFVTSEGMLPFCLHVMQFQWCLIKLLHNSVSLHWNTSISGCNQRSQRSESANTSLQQRGSPNRVHPKRTQTLPLVHKQIK